MSDPTLTPSPILDDEHATHAVIPSDVAGEDATKTACDLPIAKHTTVHAATLDRARAAGVNCLICLGWLGARHTTPPVIVKGSWYPHTPPALADEDDAAFTSRLLGYRDPNRERVPYDHRRNRQCSINYHSECSDPAGATCECPCHRQPPVGSRIVIDDQDYIVVPPEEPTDALIDKIVDDVLAELTKARDKFPGQHLPLGFGTAADGFIAGVVPYRAADLRDAYRNRTDHASDLGGLTWRHVLTEEAFEAFAEEDKAAARTELAQLAAMCVRAMLDIDDPQPVHYTGPCGVTWDQVGIDVDGAPVVTRSVNKPLTPAGVAAPTSTDVTEGPDD